MPPARPMDTPAGAARRTPLSRRECAFLLEHGGVSSDALGDAAVQEAVRKQRAQREADARVTWADLSIADLLTFEGFQDVCNAFPPEYLPVDIDRVLNAPDETWGGRSAAEWIRAGGNVQAVIEFARCLNLS